MGFTEDVIELQFGNLSGSGAGSFGASVLALISFDDPLGANPFRTIYVFGSWHMPNFLITVFAKNEKVNLTAKEQAAAVELSKEIVGMWRDKQ